MPPIRSVSSSAAQADLHAAPTETEVTLPLPETGHHRQVDRQQDTLEDRSTCETLYAETWSLTATPLYQAIVKWAKDGEQVVDRFR